MTNQASMTVFNTPGQLDARLEHLATDRYHLFVNGRWTYAYYEAHVLMNAYHEFERQGHACTVVAAGEIFFYSRRQESEDLRREKAQLLSDMAIAERNLKELAYRGQHIET
jgi:hypothetical protein